MLHPGLPGVFPHVIDSDRVRRTPATESERHRDTDTGNRALPSVERCHLLKGGYQWGCRAAMSRAESILRIAAAEDLGAYWAWQRLLASYDGCSGVSTAGWRPSGSAGRSGLGKCRARVLFPPAVRPGDVSPRG